jgi:hypothetical protein
MALRKFVAACVGLVVAVAGAAPNAEACSCSAYNGGPVWPPSGAVDVPIDTSLVVAASVSEDAVVRLADDANNEKAVQLVRALKASPGCGPSLQNKLFYRPLAPLAPNTRHTFTLTFPLRGDVITSVQTAFTTGSKPRQAPRTPVVNRWLLADDVTGAGRLLTAFLRVDHAEPVFVVAIGNPATLVESVGALAPTTSVPLPLGKVDCAVLELVDVTGTTIENLRLCQPEKCSTTNNVACGICGDNCGRSTHFSDWQNAPACANASAPDAGTAEPPVTSAGCSVAGRAPDRLALSWPLALGLACVVRRVRRSLRV